MALTSSSRPLRPRASAGGLRLPPRDDPACRPIPASRGLAVDFFLAAGARVLVAAVVVRVFVAVVFFGVAFFGAVLVAVVATGLLSFLGAGAGREAPTVL